MAIVSPNALNLFLSGGSPSRQNDVEMVSKLTDIEAEFERLVQHNEKEMREKEDYYREQLARLRQEKNQELSEKSNLQEQLMIKTIESETLKNKNA